LVIRSTSRAVQTDDHGFAGGAELAAHAGEDHIPSLAEREEEPLVDCLCADI
jgi:hypothetical protein